VDRSALLDERLRIQTEQLELLAKIRELEEELEDLERTNAPTGQRSRLQAQLRTARLTAVTLETTEKALGMRIDRLEHAQPDPVSEDRLALVERVLEVCERTRDAMKRVATAYSRICKHWEAIEARRRGDLAFATHPELSAAWGFDPETLRRELFDALYVARKDLQRLIDSSGDVVSLYPSSKELFARDKLELLLAAPPVDTVEDAPLAFQSIRISWQLDTMIEALRSERDHLAEAD